ncbi:HK97 family phage prohead protease [Granulibacter bethesdensis]|uniref:HK97 family phage prohead protease n=1 Tax=Granulibacter bethesdensis TaxID=364410 RepID=UPI0003F1EC8A|nr:HK97 family phage prohead protease [Granulibacter bethesdensis]AHJ66363.1 Phage Prohead Protease [Granulibacter bethesdensis CGDNIH4]
MSVLTRAAEGRPWRDEMAVPFECRSLAEDGSFEGYGSAFGVIEESYGTRFAPGAFSNTLAMSRRSGTMPKLLWQHDPSQPIGVYTAISEDTRGLRVQGRLTMQVQRAQEAYALLKDGALDGLSVGFRTNKYDFDDTTGIRTITDASLFEISIVTFAANPGARVDNVRSDIRTERDFEKFLRDAGFSHSRAKAIASRGFRAALRDEDQADLSGVLAALNGARQALS